MREHSSQDIQQMTKFDRKPATSLLPEDFSIPDISPLDETENFVRTNTVEFDFEHGGETFSSIIYFDRCKDYDKNDRDRILSYATPLKINISASAKDDKFNRIFGISCLFQSGPQKKTGKDPDSKMAFMNIWNIFYREVNPEYRKKGFGELSMKMLLEVIERLQKSHREFQGEYIKLDTSLSSMARLIIDQEWLKQHDLAKFQKKSGENFRFMPSDEDTEQAIEIIQHGLTDIYQPDYKSNDIEFLRTFK